MDTLLGLIRIRENATDGTVHTASPLGLLGPLGLIGDVDQAPAGNSILRIGRALSDGHGWMQTEYIVLTPAERETLIAALIEHRAAAAC